MKRPVISKTSEPKPVIADEVEAELYYGVEVNERPNGRGFIAQDSYGRDSKFLVKSISPLTTGNLWGADRFSNFSLVGLIQGLVSQNYKVFQFDTFVELADYLTYRD